MRIQAVKSAPLRLLDHLSNAFNLIETLKFPLKGLTEHLVWYRGQPFPLSLEVLKFDHTVDKTFTYSLDLASSGESISAPLDPSKRSNEAFDIPLTLFPDIIARGEAAAGADQNNHEPSHATTLPDYRKNLVEKGLSR